MKYETCRDVGIDAQRVLHHHRSGEFERRKQEVACEGRTVKDTPETGRWNCCVCMLAVTASNKHPALNRHRPRE